MTALLHAVKPAAGEKNIYAKFGIFLYLHEQIGLTMDSWSF